MSKQSAHTAEAARISEVAHRLLAEGRFGDAPLRESATVLQAVPVVELDGGLHSWYVPITVDDRLAAFFQMLPDGTLMRFSSFQRRPGDLAGFPAAADWLDPDLIRERAEVRRREDETSGEPFLTYDRAPDRLVWSVPLTQGDGGVRYVYVAGETVYEQPAGDTIG